MRRLYIPMTTVAAIVAFLTPVQAWAEAHGAGHAFDEGGAIKMLATLVFLGFTAHLVGTVFQKKTGLTEAIGWLLLGVFVSNGHYLHLPFTDALKANPGLPYASYVGVCILLIMAALETDLPQMIKNARIGGLLAALGVAIPLFAVGFGLVSVLMPTAPLATKLFIGGMVTPTSLGIAAKILKDLGVLSSKAAQLAMNVAAIDDIIGLVVMAVIQTMAGGGTVTPALVLVPIVKASLFMVIAIGIGYYLAPMSSRILSRYAGTESMRLKFVLVPCFLAAIVAHAIGLSPLMGVYAGAVFLTEAHFTDFDGKEHGAEYLFKPLAYVFVPFFFLEVGMKVDLPLLFTAKAITLFAGCLAILVGTKLALGKLGGKGVDPVVLGLATIPRGEVALVIVSSGLAVHAVDQSVFAVCVALVIGSAVVTGVFLPGAIKRAKERDPSLFAPTDPSPHMEEALTDAE